MPPKPRARPRRESALRVTGALPALLGAAYALMDEAYVRFDGGPRKRTLRIISKGSASLESLERRFKAEYEEQRVRWALAESSRAEKLSRLEQSLSAVSAAPSVGVLEPAPALSEQRRREIAALLAEPPVEDTLRIKTTWDQRGKAR